MRGERLIYAHARLQAHAAAWRRAVLVARFDELAALGDATFLGQCCDGQRRYVAVHHLAASACFTSIKWCSSVGSVALANATTRASLPPDISSLNSRIACWCAVS